MRQIITEVFQQLSAKQISTLMSIADPDEEGNIAYREMAVWAYDCLQMLIREEILSQAMSH